MTMWLFLLAFDYLSWALLCLATRRAYQQHFGVQTTRIRQRLLRTAGLFAALAAYSGSVTLNGWSLGSVNACTAWMLAAIAWVLLQTFRPRQSRWLAIVVPVVAFFALLAPAAIAAFHLSPTAFFGAP